MPELTQRRRVLVLAICCMSLHLGWLVAFVTVLFAPESKAPRARRPDPVGQLPVIVALASLTYAIIEAPRAG